jgi:hypothetical protein
MNKGLAITGGALLLFSIIGFIIGVSGVAMHAPDSDNTLHDTETDGVIFNYDGEVTIIEIYAKGDVDCYSFDILVTDGSYDYFSKDCVSGSEVEGYTYLGDLDVSLAGEYEIAADGDVVVIDADGLLAPIFAMCGGGVCCLLGLILLIVGLATGKKVPQVVMYQQPDGTIIQPNQTTVHQYIPPSNTVNEVTSTTQPVQQETSTEPSGFEPFSFERKKQP